MVLISIGSGQSGLLEGGMIFSSLRTLEYDGLLAVLARFRTSSLGRERQPLLAPGSDLASIRRQIRLTSELKERLREGRHFDFSELQRLSEVFEKLSIAASVLDPLEILEIEKLILAIHRTRETGTERREVYPSIFRLTAGLADLSSLQNRLKGKILPNGELADDASPALDSIRKSIQKVNQKIQQTLSRLLQRESGPAVLQDEVITIRNERFVVPVRIEQRKQVPGVFHGTSSSGATVYIEPFTVVDLNNDLAAFRESEIREVQRILAALSDQLRMSLDELKSSADLLMELDMAQAKARFSIEFNCCEPEINQEGTLTIEQGRHPLLEEALRPQHKAVVPISIKLNRGRNLLVISGPNTGGKTVALKTIGMASLMAQSGMHVAAERAVLPVFGRILADIGDRQSIQESLSTFASHISNIQTMVEQVTPDSLVLIDEIGTGTDPAEGEALAIALTDFFRRAGSFTIITTHFSGLKIYASQTEGAVNASVEFDEQTLRPTFRLIGGVAGASSGIDIASRLGLQDEIISHARSQLSDAHRSMTQFLNELKLEREKFEVEQKVLSHEIAATRREREQLKSEFDARWKAKTRELENRLGTLTKSIEIRAKERIENIQDAGARARARREWEEESKRLKKQAVAQFNSPIRDVHPASADVSIEEDVSDHVYRVGENVLVQSFNKQALLHRVGVDGTAEVLLGNFKMKVPLSDCKPVRAQKAPLPKPLESPPSKRAEQAKADPTLRINARPVETSELNVIGCRVDEAIEQTDKFLDQAFLADSPRVRIIHGAGMGILRRSLAEMFSKHPQVERFYSAPADQGGAGATIVELKL